MPHEPVDEPPPEELEPDPLEPDPLVLPAVAGCLLPDLSPELDPFDAPPEDEPPEDAPPSPDFVSADPDPPSDLLPPDDELPDFLPSLRLSVR